MPAPSWLTAAEAALFARMPPADQFEGLAVAATLEARGWAHDRDLLLAGLLHDAGKSLAPPRAAYRVLVTLLETLAPSLLTALARRWEPLRSLLNHAITGAEMAREAGLSADAVRLIAEHHLPARDARMAALQQADALH